MLKLQTNNFNLITSLLQASSAISQLPSPPLGILPQGHPLIRFSSHDSAANTVRTWPRSCVGKHLPRSRLPNEQAQHLPSPTAACRGLWRRQSCGLGRYITPLLYPPHMWPYHEPHSTPPRSSINTQPALGSTLPASCHRPITNRAMKWQNTEEKEPWRKLSTGLGDSRTLQHRSL